MPTSPKSVARFVARASGYLDEAPLDLLRTVEGAERVRRLVELELPLGRPDPDRVAAAAELDDLTAEEAFAAARVAAARARRRRRNGRLPSVASGAGSSPPAAPWPPRRQRLPRRPAARSASRCWPSASLSNSVATRSSAAWLSASPGTSVGQAASSCGPDTGVGRRIPRGLGGEQWILATSLELPEKVPIVTAAANSARPDREVEPAVRRNRPRWTT